MMDPKWTQLRKSKEAKWITTWIIALPYGLNDKISDDIKPTNNEKAGLNVPSLKRMYSIMWGTKRISSNGLNCEFIFTLNKYLIKDTINTVNLLCAWIALLNKKTLKNIASFLSDEIVRLPHHFKYIQCYHAILESNAIKTLLKLKQSYKKIFAILHLVTKLLKWSGFHLFSIAPMLKIQFSNQLS